MLAVDMELSHVLCCVPKIIRMRNISFRLKKLKCIAIPFFVQDVRFLFLNPVLMPALVLRWFNN